MPYRPELVAKLAFFLAATPVFASEVRLTLTFDVFCDQLSASCGTPSQYTTYQQPINGVITVIFDPAVISYTVSPWTLVAFATFGTPLFSSDLTNTLPLPIPTGYPVSTSVLNEPGPNPPFYPGTLSFSATTSDEWPAGDPGAPYSRNSVLYQIGLSCVFGFNKVVDYRDIYDQLLAWQTTDLATNPFPASFFRIREGELSSQYVNGKWVSVDYFYDRPAFLVNVQEEGTPEPSTISLLGFAMVLLGVACKKHRREQKANPHHA
jgi:hypothetical protein